MSLSTRIVRDFLDQFRSFQLILGVFLKLLFVDFDCRICQQILQAVIEMINSGLEFDDVHCTDGGCKGAKPPCVYMKA